MARSPRGKTVKNNRLRKLLWPEPIWRKALVFVVVLIVIDIAVMYGAAQWYINKHKNEPLTIGTTFISDYAESFGLDPEETLDAILSDLAIKRIRLVSYWKKIEPSPGQYDFSELDWQFAMAEKRDAKVSLVIGLRQPRWPECHEPEWVHSMSKEQWQPALYNFIAATVDRYKNRPALMEYQLENEFFMEVFGECTDFDGKRLVEEFNLVKGLDGKHPVIVSRSNNWIGIPIGSPTPDQFAISVYKRVWDATITKRYFEYPLPAWFYASLAGLEELVSGRDMIIHRQINH
jgi:hypothetical protein